jgi:maleylacetoacetate isomerase
MMKMYGFWRSAATFRVRTALNLKGLNFEETMIDLDAGEQNAPAFKAINPAGSVPAVFVDDGAPLTQSLAVLEYLEELHPQPPLLPADPRGRARVRSLALVFSADSHPLIVPRVVRYLADAFAVDDAGRAEWIKHWLREGLLLGEARLASDPATGRFCHGDAPTIADLCLMSHVLRARAVNIPIADLPTVERISEACLAIDAFANAAPLRQPGAPAAPERPFAA